MLLLMVALIETAGTVGQLIKGAGPMPFVDGFAESLYRIAPPSRGGRCMLPDCEETWPYLVRNAIEHLGPLEYTELQAKFFQRSQNGKEFMNGILRQVRQEPLRDDPEFLEDLGLIESARPASAGTRESPKTRAR